jgi:hypothetical protein
MHVIYWVTIGDRPVSPAAAIDTPDLLGTFEAAKAGNGIKGHDEARDAAKDLVPGRWLAAGLCRRRGSADTADGGVLGRRAQYQPGQASGRHC